MIEGKWQQRPIYSTNERLRKYINKNENKNTRSASNGGSERETQNEDKNKGAMSTNSDLIPHYNHLFARNELNVHFIIIYV